MWVQFKNNNVKARDTRYWFGYRNHIINNLGYGAFGNFNGNCCPGRVALGEAIGNFLMKMLTNNFSFLFLVVLSLLVGGCQKESFKVKKGSHSIESRSFGPYLLAELAHKYWDGSISISNRKLFGTEEAAINSENTDIYATFLNSFHNGRESEGKLAITAAESTLNLLPDERHVYRTGKEETNIVKGFYGSEVSLSLEGENQPPGGVFAENLDIPDPIYVTSPVLGNTFTTSLGRDLDLAWNADAGNENGVFIVIAFDPGSPWNSGIENAEEVYNVIHIEDTGSYSLSEDDFSGIPSGARVEILVGRGKYQKAVDAATQRKEYIIYAYSVARGRITLQ